MKFSAGQGSWTPALDFPRKGSNAILWNYQGWSFVLSEISSGKRKKLKIVGEFQKSMSSTPCLFFSGNSAQYNTILNKPTFYSRISSIKETAVNIKAVEKMWKPTWKKLIGDNSLRNCLCQ